MAKLKQTVVVMQCENPRFNDKEQEQFNDTLPVEKQNVKYLYIVKSLKNILEPPIHTRITAREVERLMKSGVEVNVVTL